MTAEWLGEAETIEKPVSDDIDVQTQYLISTSKHDPDGPTYAITDRILAFQKPGRVSRPITAIMFCPSHKI
jgi:hypothetical protein